MTGLRERGAEARARSQRDGALRFRISARYRGMRDRPSETSAAEPHRRKHIIMRHAPGHRQMPDTLEPPVGGVSALQTLFTCIAGQVAVA